MKKLSLLLIAIATIITAGAQQKPHVLKGQVVNSSNQAIHNAAVYHLVTADSIHTDSNGLFQLFSSKPINGIEVIKSGYHDVRVATHTKSFVTVSMQSAIEIDQELTVPKAPMELEDIQAVTLSDHATTESGYPSRHKLAAPMGMIHHVAPPVPQNNESYAEISENDFHYAAQEPLSTFSIDVDRAAYSNVRRFLNNGQLPPVDAVRIEEMVNYFDYEYDSPTGKDPVRIFTEVAQAPWNADHQLLHIGIRARDMDKEKLPASNLVFLIDVSGSMNAANKLPLLKSSMKMLVQQMRKEDRVAIVVYAGAAGLVLESTSGSEKQKIYSAIDNLNAGGSTAGGAGIKLAYQVALENFAKDGNNRIVLATDGDFNVGASSDQAMEHLIEAKRNQGVFLTVLGFGMGNYKDSKMEILADKGNGNYAYIDNITEAKKTLVNEFGGTMYTIAKDVKIQIEFNPANVAEYRLIGYENRMLAKEDFNNDKKDAGEMGVGHVVTALYEIVPIGRHSNRVDPLKYQPQSDVIESAVHTDEMATVKLRYKQPDSHQSILMAETIKQREQSIDKASLNLRWSASIAHFGMLLRNSDHIGSGTYATMIPIAQKAIGEDKEGYRRECVQLMKAAEMIEKSNTAQR
ncbi:MAG: hypothetical protein Salg2KO_19640 [Salibacteraceae bacterium]